MNFGFCFHPTLHREDCSGFLNLWLAVGTNKTRFIPTRYDIRHEEWDPVKGWLGMPGHIDKERLQLLHYYARCMRADLDNLHKIITELKIEHAAIGADFSVNDVIRHWNLSIPMTPLYEPLPV
jgi:hypothetical protein